MSKRSESKIFEDFRDIECQLSPENLTHDGERSKAEVVKAASQLKRQRAALVKELGREPSFKELYKELYPN